LAGSARHPCHDLRPVFALPDDRSGVPRRHRSGRAPATARMRIEARLEDRASHAHEARERLRGAHDFEAAGAVSLNRGVGRNYAGDVRGAARVFRNTEYSDVVAQMKRRLSFGPPKHTLDTLSGTRILPSSEPSLA